MKNLTSIATAITLVGSLMAPGEVFAQSPASMQPITQKRLTEQTAIASMTSCILSTNKKYSSSLSIMDSIAVTATPVTGFITQVHGGMIAGVNDGKKLTPEQIQQGLFLQTMAMVKSRCYDKLTVSDQKMIDKTEDQAKAGN